MIFIDSAALDLVERLCRRFQLLTGRTNVWLAIQLTNLSIVVYFVWAAVLYWSSADLALRVFVASFCIAVFIALTRTIFKTSIETSELDAYRRVAKGLRNPRRVRDAQLRISFLVLSLVLSPLAGLTYRLLRLHGAILSYSLIVLTTVVLYVLACDPLPPSPGKLWQWATRLAPARVASSE